MFGITYPRCLYYQQPKNQQQQEEQEGVLVVISMIIMIVIVLLVAEEEILLAVAMHHPSSRQAADLMMLAYEFGPDHPLAAAAPTATAVSSSATQILKLNLISGGIIMAAILLHYSDSTKDPCLFDHIMPLLVVHDHINIVHIVYYCRQNCIMGNNSF